MPARRFFRLTSLFSLAFGVLATGLISVANAQDKGSDLFQTPAIFGNTATVDVDIEVTAILKPVSADSVELQVTAILPDGYYIYSMDKSFGAATSIELTDLSGLTTSDDWKPDHEPKVVADDVLGQTVEKFFGSVTWSTTLKGPLTAGLQIKGKLSGQYCGSGENGVPGECRPVHDREFVARLVDASRSATAPESSAMTDSTVVTAPLADTNPIVLSPKIGYGKAAKAGLMRFDVALTPAKPRVGDEVTLSITAHIEEPWHTFALDQDPDMAGLPTTIELTATSGLKEIRQEFMPTADPEVKTIEEYTQRIHHGEITWTRTFLLSDPSASVSGSIRFQLCSNGTCLPPTAVEFELTLSAGTGVEPSSRALQSPPTTTASAGSSTPEIGSDGFFAFVLTAIGAGFVALLTPCVFPMIPVTVAFFLKQEEKKPGSSLKLALVYCLSIIGAFTVLGLIAAAAFGPTSLTALANNRWLNLAFAALFTVFALMLMGIWEVQIPSWLLTWTSKRESTGGLIGVVFMAITFALVSFTCTFAFVGSLLVLAARGTYLWPVIGMLGFSTAFASPFFFLAMFPKMLKRLPRSGGWMNDVKITIGLLELAAVVKFLSVADIGFSVGRIPVYITYNIFMVSWILLALAAGFNLLGVFSRIAKPNFSLIRHGFVVFFFAFTARLIAGMTGLALSPDPVWNLVAAFAPPDVEVRNTDELGYVIAHHKMDFAMEFERAVIAASKDQQALFVDFTGVNCVNCRQMERTVMVESRVIEALQKTVRAQLYTDEVPGITDAALRDRLVDMNRELQSNLVEDVTLPNYAIVSADGKTVLSVFKGLDSSGGKDFLQFLNAGLNRWELLKTQNATASVNRDATPSSSL